jgi:hypothetical protein
MSINLRMAFSQKFDYPSLKNINQSAEVVSKFDNESKQLQSIYLELNRFCTEIKTILWKLKIV